MAIINKVPLGPDRHHASASHVNCEHHVRFWKGGSGKGIAITAVPKKPGSPGAVQLIALCRCTVVNYREVSCLGFKVVAVVS